MVLIQQARSNLAEFFFSENQLLCNYALFLAVQDSSLVELSQSHHILVSNTICNIRP